MHRHGPTHLFRMILLCISTVSIIIGACSLLCGCRQHVHSFSAKRNTSCLNKYAETTHSTNYQSRGAVKKYLLNVKTSRNPIIARRDIVNTQGQHGVIWTYDISIATTGPSVNISSIEVYHRSGDGGWKHVAAISQDELSSMFKMKKGVVKQGIRYMNRHAWAQAPIVGGEQVKWCFMSVQGTRKILAGSVIINAAECVL